VSQHLVLHDGRVVVDVHLLYCHCGNLQQVQSISLQQLVFL
jgi:hypothetical protein